jgi:hypothetical protein
MFILRDPVPGLVVKSQSSLTHLQLRCAVDFSFETGRAWALMPWPAGGLGFSSCNQLTHFPAQPLLTATDSDSPSSLNLREGGNLSRLKLQSPSIPSKTTIYHEKFISTI